MFRNSAVADSRVSMVNCKGDRRAVPALTVSSAGKNISRKGAKAAKKNLTCVTIAIMRVAVLGLGYMGSVHVKALRMIPDVDLTVVSRHEARLAGDFSDVRGNVGAVTERMDFSNVRKYREVAAALEDPEIDAVDICLPTDLHESIAIEALRRGKHVLVEK